MTGTSVNGKYDVKVINMFVVPIKISNANLKNTFMAYATLDNFSQGFHKTGSTQEIGCSCSEIEFEPESTYCREIKRNRDAR